MVLGMANIWVREKQFIVDRPVVSLVKDMQFYCAVTTEWLCRLRNSTGLTAATTTSAASVGLAAAHRNTGCRRSAGDGRDSASAYQ